MTSSRIFIHPLSAHKSPACRLKTNSLWDDLYSMTIHRLCGPPAFFYTQIWSAFHGFGFELKACPLLEMWRSCRLCWTSLLLPLRVLAWFLKMTPLSNWTHSEPSLSAEDERWYWSSSVTQQLSMWCGGPMTVTNVHKRWKDSILTVTATHGPWSTFYWCLAHPKTHYNFALNALIWRAVKQVFCGCMLWSLWLNGSEWLIYSISYDIREWWLNVRTKVTT